MCDNKRREGDTQGSKYDDYCVGVREVKGVVEIYPNHNMDMIGKGLSVCLSICVYHVSYVPLSLLCLCVIIPFHFSIIMYCCYIRVHSSNSVIYI